MHTMAISNHHFPALLICQQNRTKMTKNFNIIQILFSYNMDKIDGGYGPIFWI